MFGLVPFKFNNGENSRGLTINDMFNDFFNDDMLADFKSCGNFKTDIKETPEEYIVHAELPGVKKEDIKIDTSNGRIEVLNVSAENIILDSSNSEAILNNINEIVYKTIPPKLEKKRICKSCAYYDLCFI